MFITAAVMHKNQIIRIPSYKITVIDLMIGILQVLKLQIPTDNALRG